MTWTNLSEQVSAEFAEADSAAERLFDAYERRRQRTLSFAKEYARLHIFEVKAWGRARTQRRKAARLSAAPILVCPRCKTSFKPTHANRKFCSDTCQRDRRNGAWAPRYITCAGGPHKFRSVNGALYCSRPCRARQERLRAKLKRNDLSCRNTPA